MDGVWGIATAFGHGIEWVLDYVESHHWIFGVAVAGYVFYRHDRSPRACFDARDKRIDEVRRRPRLLSATPFAPFRPVRAN